MSSAAPRKLARATLADWSAIPEAERRHELVDGELFEKGAASAEHGTAQGRVFRSLGPFDRRPGGRWPGGWWFATETDVLFDPEHVLRPDVAGWRRERSPEPPRGCPVELVPDWICEVLSTNRRNDLIRKKRAYHRHHVGHYWLVDPADETLLVYRWSPDGYLETLAAQRGERVRAEPFDAIELAVGVFFGDDDDDDD